MLLKRITYTDYNGQERTEDFYFNLSKAEIMEMEMSTTGGLADSIKKIIETIDIPSIIKTFKEVILKSYGEKSADGKRFIKNAELAEAFAQTEAYSNLFMELATNEEEAANFINGIIPNDLAEQVAAQPEQIANANLLESNNINN